MKRPRTPSPDPTFLLVLPKGRVDLLPPILPSWSPTARPSAPSKPSACVLAVVKVSSSSSPPSFSSTFSSFLPACIAAKLCSSSPEPSSS